MSLSALAAGWTDPAGPAMGSPAAASLVAHLAFWILVGWGVVPVGLAYTSYGPSLYSPVVARLDIILVVFKGDVRLT